jgi:tRNA threonylcarbamoyladenosine biosynthesis protein TsaE
MQLKSKSVEDLAGIAKAIVESHPDDRVFAFYGKMGAGKTTLIKAICEVLGVEDTTSSPSFALINQYQAETRSMIYHFDFYRIKKIEEAFDLGYEEYFYSGEYCFIEWPEKIEELLPENCVYIKIDETEDDGVRIINF